MKRCPKFFLLNNKITSYHKTKYPEWPREILKEGTYYSSLSEDSLKGNFSAFYLHHIKTFQKEFPKSAKCIHSPYEYLIFNVYPDLF